MDKSQIDTLKDWDNHQWYPTRALLWTWWKCPKKYRDEDGNLRHVTKIEQFCFTWLRRHKDEYYEFLAAHNLKKNTYDLFIGNNEPEERTTW